MIFRLDIGIPYVTNLLDSPNVYATSFGLASVRIFSRRYHQLMRTNTNLIVRLIAIIVSYKFVDTPLMKFPSFWVKPLIELILDNFLTAQRVRTPSMQINGNRTLSHPVSELHDKVIPNKAHKTISCAVLMHVMGFAFAAILLKVFFSDGKGAWF